MKRLISLLCVLCLLLPFLIGCDADNPVYIKHMPAKTEETACAELFRVLSDGTILLLQSKKPLIFPKSIFS